MYREEEEGKIGETKEQRSQAVPGGGGVLAAASGPAVAEGTRAGLSVVQSGGKAGPGRYGER